MTTSLKQLANKLPGELASQIPTLRQLIKLEGSEVSGNPYALYKNEDIDLVLLAHNGHAYLLLKKCPDASFEGACEGGHQDIAKRLIDVSSVDLRCGLIVAYEEGNREVIEYITSKGAKIINSRALYYASRGGHLDIVKSLEKEDINGAMCAACSKGHLDVANYLISLGADFK